MVASESLAFYDTTDFNRGTGGSSPFLADLCIDLAVCVDAIFAMDRGAYSGFRTGGCDSGDIYCKRA